MKRYVVAMTGASGTVYGIRLVGEMLKTAQVHLVISENTFPIILDETGLDWSGDTESAVRGYFRTDRIRFHDDRQMWAPVASGSFRTDGDGTRRFEGWLSGVYLTVIIAELEGVWSCDKTGVMPGEFGDYMFPLRLLGFLPMTR